MPDRAMEVIKSRPEYSMSWNQASKTGIKERKEGTNQETMAILLAHSRLLTFCSDSGSSTTIEVLGCRQLAKENRETTLNTNTEMMDMSA